MFYKDLLQIIQGNRDISWYEVEELQRLLLAGTRDGSSTQKIISNLDPYNIRLIETADILRRVVFTEKGVVFNSCRDYRGEIRIIRAIIRKSLLKVKEYDILVRS